MKCDLCDKSATVHLIEIQSGQKIEKHLCEEHAAQEGVAVKTSQAPINELLEKFVLKHAEAERVVVRLHLDESKVRLGIEDNGKGFRKPASWVELGREDHFGLLGLSERVMALGADLDVRSSPGEGTTVQVEVDLMDRKNKVQA